MWTQICSFFYYAQLSAVLFVFQISIGLSVTLFTISSNVSENVKCDLLETCTILKDFSAETVCADSFCLNDSVIKEIR